MVITGKVISKMVSKKGSTLVSCFRSSDKLVDNCIVSKSTNVEFNVGDTIKGEMIFNNDGLNTIIVTEIINTK